MIFTPVARHGGDALEVSKRLGLPIDSILDFSLNVNPYGPPASVYEAIRNYVSHIRFYPERSYSRLKSAISGFLGMEEECVIVGCGSTELIHSILARFVRDGPVVLPLPSFSEYEAAAAALGLDIRFVNPAGLRVDLKSALGIVEEGIANCVILCNPNNPTGELLDVRLVKELIQSADERGIPLLLDEAYLDLCEGSESLTFAPAVKEFRNLFVLRSLTKPFGFPGLRVGYAVCSPDSAREFESTAMSWRVGVLEEAAAVSALEERDFLQESKKKIRSEKEKLIEGIGSIKGLRPVESKSNFMMVDISGAGLAPRNLRWRLLSYGVLVRELGSVRGLPGKFIRICVRKPEENRFLLEALRNVINSLDKMHPHNVSCNEKKCHEKVDDCRLCFCPFYPCLDGATGGAFVSRDNGGIVWGCKDCNWVHRTEVADAVLDGLSRINVRSDDPETILNVRRGVLKACPPRPTR
ncbi:MAG: aminotransferase class I/II-fold pyridoxal phosphate-dependent enzyme [Candidatus Verstraetearchaeota archaeon]|nr:aminotransferase class I/II-fold pyridoxal phosphate-dependent enzyme [Candidatus Verstraetearchaeota archaeon]